MKLTQAASSPGGLVLSKRISRWARPTTQVVGVSVRIMAVDLPSAAARAASGCPYG
jgi:hypothetical protein